MHLTLLLINFRAVTGFISALAPADAGVSATSWSPGSASCLWPACLPRVTRQDTEPVNHNAAASSWFPVDFSVNMTRFTPVPLWFFDRP